MAEVLAESQDRQLWHKEMMARVVVLENVPQAPPEKYAKLKDVLSSIVQKAGEISEDGVHLPQTEDGGANGYAFVQFRSPEVAQKALRKLDQYQMDRSHVLNAIQVGEIERVLQVKDEFVESSVDLSSVKKSVRDQTELPAWLKDERGREQYAVMQEDNAIEIFWFDMIGGMEQNYAKMRWTDSRAIWSPRGSFLATFHNPGIILWGGPKWEELVRIRQPNIKFAQFSPREKFLVTWNGLPSTPEDGDDKCVIVWDVETGTPLRSFPALADANGEPPAWPIFKWCHDDRFFARIGEDAISVYTTPGMGLLDRKSLKLPRVMDFEWSPTDPIIAYWLKEEGDAPARVALMELPSRVELRQKGLYSVTGVELKWKEDGDFLGCRVERHAKNRKVQYFNFELFHMRDKNYPIDTLEIKEKEVVEAFEWEPKGNRFGVIHGELPNRSVSFYSMESTSNGKLKHLFTLEKKPFNTIRWSPAGTLVALARLGNPNEAVNGSFEWYNVNDQDMIGLAEHYSSTGFEWDSSGRFAASYTALSKHKQDNGYIIYNMSGKELAVSKLGALHQFMWRPRPPLLLSPEEEKSVRKNMKQYRDRFEKEDEELRESKRSGKAARRRELREQWKQYLGTRAEFQAEIEEVRQATRPADSQFEVIEEVKEELIDVQEEVDYNRRMLTSDDERD